MTNERVLLRWKNFALVSIGNERRASGRKCSSGEFSAYIKNVAPNSCTLKTRPTTFPGESVHLAVFIYVADTRPTIPAGVLFQMLSIINVYRCCGTLCIVISTNCCFLIYYSYLSYFIPTLWSFKQHYKETRS